MEVTAGQTHSTSTDKTEAESHKPWFVLLATDPKKAEYRLTQRNMDEEKHGCQPCFSLFVPYTSMGASPSENGNPGQVTLRSALRRYLFVRGDEKLLSDLLPEWNRTSDNLVFFLRDASGNHARISQHDMNKLKAACGSEQMKLDMPILLHELKPGTSIPLVGTPFDIKDATYKLLSVKRKKGGVVELQVELSMFNVTFKNLFVTYLDPLDKNVNATLVASAQKKLLDIFRRRVNGKRTEVSDYEDRKALHSIFEKRDTPFPDGAMKRHFLAMMLICSHLLGDEEATRRFMQEVLQELDDISRLRESKASTDTRAYLHVACYIATGEPQYREQAKTYIQKYQPRSQYLTQFVSTSAKRQAGKCLGAKARKKEHATPSLHA